MLVPGLPGQLTLLWGALFYLRKKREKGKEEIEKEREKGERGRRKS